MAFAVKTVTIANAASLSSEADLDQGHTVVGIIMPAAWTAATLTFQATAGSTTFNNVYNTAGTEYESQAAASRWIAIDPADFAGADKLKVRSGTSGAAVNQGAERIITIVTRGVS